MNKLLLKPITVQGIGHALTQVLCVLVQKSINVIPSGSGEGIETESSDALLTEDGQEILLDKGDDEMDAVTTESGEQLLAESNEVITIE